MNTMVSKTGMSPYRAYAQAVKANRLDGKRLHFDKSFWLLGENERLENSTHAVAIVTQLKIGWQFWRGGEPGDEYTGLLSEGFRPLQRRELGDLDETLWERKSDGTAKDPWSKVNLLPLVLADTNQVCTYTTPAKGGFSAIGALCEDFDDHGGPDVLPLIALEADSYTHKTYGRVHVPVLRRLKYVPAARFNAALASVRGERTTQPPVSDPETERPAGGRMTVTSGRQSAPPTAPLEAPPISDDDDSYAGRTLNDDIPF
jgi:hypothetical protein